jgi:hypothetical protein
MEKWAVIPGEPNRLVSSKGRIAKTVEVGNKGKGRGRPKVIIRTGDYKAILDLIDLVVELHMPPRPSEHHVVCFKDGNNWNVDVDNLEWREEWEVQQELMLANRR